VKRSTFLVLIARLHNRQLETQYVREYFIPFRMMPDRMAQIRDLIEPLPTTPVNSDFKPIAYYFDVVLWSAQFKSVSARPFQSVSRVAFTPAIATLVAVLFLIAVAFAFLPPPQKRVRSSVVFCVAATGFTLMTLQIFLLLAFQSVYGYVYHQLATLIAMFMAGIAFGNWLGMRRGPLTNAPLRIMAAVQFLMALSALALMFLIQSLAQISGGTSALLTAQFIFPALAACSGMLGGYQFPVATSLYLKDDGATSQLGVLYAVDLAGGCVGALLLSGYLIPVFGFWKTAWISAAVNLAPALLAARLGLEARLSRA
jgi:spermidine synthase